MNWRPNRISREKVMLGESEEEKRERGRSDLEREIESMREF